MFHGTVNYLTARAALELLAVLDGVIHGAAPGLPLGLPRPAAAPLCDAPSPGLRHAARRVHQQPVQHLVTWDIFIFIYET